MSITITCTRCFSTLICGEFVPYMWLEFPLVVQPVTVVSRPHIVYLEKETGSYSSILFSLDIESFQLHQPSAFPSPVCKPSSLGLVLQLSQTVTVVLCWHLSSFVSFL